MSRSRMLEIPVCICCLIWEQVWLGEVLHVDADTIQLVWFAIDSAGWNGSTSWKVLHQIFWSSGVDDLVLSPMLETLEGLRNVKYGATCRFEFIKSVKRIFCLAVCLLIIAPPQPFGILHGGASCVLSETLGVLLRGWQLILINIAPVDWRLITNHIRAVTEGFVIGVCTPLHGLGRRTQVWQTDMTEKLRENVLLFLAWPFLLSIRNT